MFKTRLPHYEKTDKFEEREKISKDPFKIFFEFK